MRPHNLRGCSHNLEHVLVTLNRQMAEQQTSNACLSALPLNASHVLYSSCIQRRVIQEHALAWLIYQAFVRSTSMTI